METLIEASPAPDLRRKAANSTENPCAFRKDAAVNGKKGCSGNVGRR